MPRRSCLTNTWDLLFLIYMVIIFGLTDSNPDRFMSAKYCIAFYCMMRPYTEGRLDRYRIGIPRELSEIRTQPWLSEGSLTCDPYHHRGPIF